jgi:hypothetical protein
MICEQLEDTTESRSWGGIQLKNSSIISLSKVCIRFTRLILSNRLLFKSICFDHRDETQDVAKLCLDAVQNSNCPIDVYLDFKSTTPSGPKTDSLVRRLSSLVPQIQQFGYRGDLGPYRELFTHASASTLHEFYDSLDRTTSTPLFLGIMPHLRHIQTTTTTITRQITMPLQYLIRLELASSTPDPISLQLFLTVLEATPVLETLILYFVHFTPDIGGGRILLPNLRYLSIYVSDLPTLLHHLDIPIVQRISCVGWSDCTGYTTLRPLPLFDSPHLFATLPSIAIFKQPMTHVLVTVDMHAFRFVLEGPGDFGVDISLSWARPDAAGWEDYVANSVDALAGLLTLAPDSCADLSIRSASPRPIYTAFLRSKRLKNLFINGGFTTGVLDALSNLSPQLQRLIILDPEPWLPSSVELLKTCLTSRRGDLSIRLNNTHGELPLPILAAAHCVPRRESHPHFDAVSNR